MIEFHNTDPGHNKFWSIEEDHVHPLTVVVRWGAIGTRGQTQRKSFSTPDEQADFIENKVNEKLARGYYQV